jgi:ankyrin repeat protein
LQAGARLNESGALHVAAIRGDLAKMKLLLQYGASVNEVPRRTVSAFVRYTKRGSPAHWAIAGGLTDAVQLLLECHPGLSVLDEDGVSVRDRLREAQYSSGGV